ncbi:MoxR-like ATPase [Alkalibacterium putridalgicola]|uniref:Magnesium chelatase n=1 Tax=Alkalibacterium putridalgicola TaxID=426703 RepID=A0A1H7VF25_9LACT|nr:MoxR family ATPase [Alkalibacterium putridalgicola]GEK89779.1 magnesium chelatase [Alkalibacterium putridalgicola]SEM07448.1 MoxR-like ATPase [Alkalibacterium putridalgicola]
MALFQKTHLSIEKLHTLIDTVDSIVIGKKDVTRLTIVAMLAGGHILFEDIPGVGKTLLIRTIAKCLDADFARIQFTPDLIPSDIIGFSVPNAEGTAFNFRKGPIFNQLLLADEINRTSPRTQAAMLEAMSEKQVTLDGETHTLPEPFFVLATQNPIEYKGTYPLPEAQLDRFLFQLSLGYPDTEQEVQMLAAPDQQKAVEILQPVMTLDEFLTLKEAAAQVYVDDSLLQYIVSLALLTRNHPAIRLGISPRGNQFALASARAHALLAGRDYVVPQDILDILKPLYRHRLLFETHHSKEEIDAFIDQLTRELVIPKQSRHKR